MDAGEPEQKATAGQMNGLPPRNTLIKHLTFRNDKLWAYTRFSIPHLLHLRLGNRPDAIAVKEY